MRTLCDEIEALIAESGLGPGARLPAERQLAAQLGVSRARLREELQKLISRGRLRVRRGGGTFVAAPEDTAPVTHALSSLSPLARAEPGYWQDVMDIRRSLEPDTAAWAALRASETDKVRLQAALDQTLSGEGRAPALQARADAAFHLAVAQASHNAVLHHLLAGLFDLLSLSISRSLETLYELPNPARALDEQHRAIVAAILAGEPEEAREAARRHLDFVADHLRHIQDEDARAHRSARALAHAAEQKDPLP